MDTNQVHEVANTLAAMRRASRATAVELEEDLWDIPTLRTAGFDDGDAAEAEVRLHEYHPG